MEAELLRLLVGDMLMKHALPWRIDRDWTWEVYDAQNQLVAKLPRPEVAEALLALANEVQAEHDRFVAEELPKLLAED